MARSVAVAGLRAAGTVREGRLEGLDADPVGSTAQLDVRTMSHGSPLLAYSGPRSATGRRAPGPASGIVRAWGRWRERHPRLLGGEDDSFAPSLSRGGFRREVKASGSALGDIQGGGWVDRLPRGVALGMAGMPCASTSPSMYDPVGRLVGSGLPPWRCRPEVHPAVPLHP